MPIRWCAVVLSWTLAVSAAADDADALVQRFVADLQQDSLAILFRDLPYDTDTEVEWFGTKELIDAARCITVETAAVTREQIDGDTMRLEVTLRGSAISAGRGRPRDIPMHWILTGRRTADGWRLAGANTVEDALAQLAVTADDDGRRAAVLSVPHADWSVFARRLAARQKVRRFAGIVPIEFARQLAAMQGDRAAEAYCVRSAAGNLLISREPEKGAQLAQESLTLARESGSPDDVAEALFIVANARWFNGSAEDAIPVLLESARMIDRIDDPSIALRSLYVTGQIASSMKDSRMAARVNDELEALSKQYGWLEGEKNAAVRAGALYAELGDIELSMHYEQRSVELARLARDPRVLAYGLYNLATTLIDIGDAEAALRLIDEALEVAPPDIHGPVQLGRAEALTILRRWDEAEEAWNRGLASVRERDTRALTATALAGLSAVALAKGNCERALELAREAVLLRGGGGTDKITSDARDDLPATAEANALACAGRVAEAEAAYRATIAEIEATRSELPGGVHLAQYLRPRSAPYRRLVELLTRERRLRDALAASASLKARTLVDLAQRAAGKEKEQPDAAMRDERRRALIEQIEKLNEASLACTGACAAVRAELAHARAELQRLDLTAALVDSVSRPKTGTADADPLAADSFVDEHTLFLDYVAGENETTLFTAMRNRRGEVVLDAVSLPIGERALRDRIGAYVKMLEARDLAAAAEASRLYELLLRPVESLFAGRRRICIVPDGPLWRLPFSTLRRGDGKVLAELIPVTFAPSLVWLSKMHALPGAPRAQADILALGDPAVAASTTRQVAAVMRAELGPLPEAAAEARQIAALYAPRGRALIGANATERAVKESASRYRILHFAAHALANEAQPLFASIVLAADEAGADDGLLEAREVLDLQMNADLVVLSACDTARGTYAAGEGVIGLAWAVLAAGARTTIVSQWRADSKAAARLMVELHRRLVAGDPPSEALRRAQVALRRDPRYRDPMYWAPFVAIGTDR